MSGLFESSNRNENQRNGSPRPVEWIIAGLGNPGPDYAETRHNAGFMALDSIAKKYAVSVNESKFRALVGRCVIADRGVLLMKPQTMMNASGDAIREAAKFYKIPSDHILILYDDISLDVGRIRIRRSGSAGGHNGIKSILAQLSEDSFPRIKIGVGQKPHPDYDLAAWVLGKFASRDLLTLQSALERVLPSVELILSGKSEEAMNLYNR